MAVRVLPLEERLCLADAPAVVPALADRVLPLSQVAPGGRLRSAHDALRAEVRAREGRVRDPSAAVIDSQALKTSRAGRPERKQVSR
ncbi:MAG: hypothetical protein JOZ19_07860 [Rubrobacter sp.]|nr:hypothetical protein [Rubrobacter sp.]